MPYPLPAILGLAGRAAPPAAPRPAWQLVVALVVLVALLAAGLAIWLYRRRPPRRPPRRPARPRYPVVLAHGLFGFDEIRLGSARHAYFRGVPARLERSGVDVRLASVARVGSIAERARELVECIEAIGTPKVNVVAHSMGGLDARYAISRLGLGSKVASLTTIGTPHRGTPIADLGAALERRLGLGRAFEAMGVRLDAVGALTVRRMTVFNRRVADVQGVAYGSVVGAVHRKRQVNPLLLPGYLYLKERAGENDGMVPASSQEWGEVLFRIEADHWAQIGWSRHFDAVEFYALLLRELRGRGF